MIHESKTKEHLITCSHHCMAVVGGFMGGFTILTRGDLFGNAQTANMISLVHFILGKDFLHFFLRLLAVFVYALGTAAYVMIKNKTDWNIKKVSILVDYLAVVLLGFFPESMEPVIALYPVFFAMSFQWNSFPGNYGYASSTIFSTNNIRQTTLAFSEYLCDKDKKHLHKMWFFLGTLLGFHTGVAVSWFAAKYLGYQGIWLNGVILLAAGVFVWLETSHETRNEKTKLPVRTAVANIYK